MTALPNVGAGGRSRSIALVAVLATGQAACAGGAAFATRDVFAALSASDKAFPVESLSIIAAAGLGIAGSRIAGRVAAERVGQSYAAELRLKLFKHMSRLPAHVLAERRQGGLALRFVGDLSAVRNWVSLGIARTISSVIVVVLATLALFLLNPALGLAAAVPILAGLLIMALAAPWLGPLHQRLRSRRARLAADLSERLPHAPELRLLGRMPREERALARRTDEVAAAAVDRVRAATSLRAVADAVAGLAAASLLYVAFSTEAGTADAAGALAAVSLMIQPMRSLAGVWDRYRAWTTARDKCTELLEQPIIRRRTRRGETLADGPLGVEFDRTSRAGLRRISAVATAGEKIAIFGPNGSGKSTLIALAAGLDEPTKGRVRVGETSPTELGVAERQRAITLIGPRSPVLSGSLRRALTFGTCKRPSDARVLEVAAKFGLGAVIRRLGGLDGHVAEGGRNLSAGEVRRLTLARAALSRSGLLLLDEPDETLDAGGEDLLAHLIRETDATVLLVTHSRTLAERMDRIWRIEGGRLVEDRPTTGGPVEATMDLARTPQIGA